jgi:hypothetical protein
MSPERFVKGESERTVSKTYRLFCLIILCSIDKRVVHNATELETVVRPLETVAALQRFGNGRQESRLRG